MKMFKAIVIFWLFCLFFIHGKCDLIEYLLICYSPEEKIRQLEKKVNELIEESCFANSTGDLSLVQRILVLMFVKNCKAYAKSGLSINWFLIITATMKTISDVKSMYAKVWWFSKKLIFDSQALEKAKEAGRKERVLVRQREQQSMGDQINLDLTYSVCNLWPQPYVNFDLKYWVPRWPCLWFLAINSVWTNFKTRKSEVPGSRNALNNVKHVYMEYISYSP